MTAKRILTVLLCIAMLLTVFAAASCKKKAPEPTPEEAFAALTPEQKFSASFAKTSQQVDKWENVSAISKVLTSAMTAGSAQVNVVLDETFTDMEEPITVNAKVWANGGKYALDADLGLAGQSFAAKAYLNDADALIVDSTSLLGGVYGVNLKTLTNDLSAFLTRMGVPAEAITEIESAVAEAMDSVKKTTEMTEQEKAAVEKLITIISDGILNNITINAEQKSVKVFDKDVDATCLTFRLNNDNAAAILNSIYTGIKADADVCALIDELLATAATAASVTDIDDDEFPANAEELFLLLDPEIAEAVDEIKNSETKFSADLTLSLSNVGVIMRVDASVSVDETPAVVSIELGEKLDTFEGLNISALIPVGDGITLTMTAKATVTKTADTETFTFVTTGLGEILGANIEITATHNKTSGDTVIDAKIPGDSYDDVTGDLIDTVQTVVISFNYKETDGTHVIGNFAVTYNGDAIPLPRITVTLKENDTMPAAPETYKNILQMSEAELQAFLGTVQEKIAPLTEMFGGDDEYDPFDDEEDGSDLLES